MIPFLRSGSACLGGAGAGAGFCALSCSAFADCFSMADFILQPASTSRLIAMARYFMRDSLLGLCARAPVDVKRSAAIIWPHRIILVRPATRLQDERNVPLVRLELP